MTSELAAALDVGTNTVLLLIGRRGANGELEVLDDRCETPRLGQGVAARGVLDPEAIERTLAVLRRFREALEAARIPPARLRAVGTAVLRRAHDARDFVARVEAELGLSIEIASEEEEARLSYRAVASSGSGLDALVIDVGGGSTELICSAGRERYSAPVGALVLCETFAAQGATPPERVAELVRHVREACLRFPAGAARREPRAEVVGLGGSALNLAALELGLQRFDHRVTEGARVPASSALRWAERLFALETSARARLPIEATRAGILPCGLVCLGAVLERIGAAEVRLSGRGLRFGVLQELLSGAQEPPGPRQVRAPG